MPDGSFDVDFQTTTNIYNTPFNNFWGNSTQLSLSSQGMLIGSGPNNDYNAMGIMQSASGNNAGEGYGVYSYTARYEYANQPGGDYLLLWRADNIWLDSSKPGVITEMDMLETWDNSKTEQSTLHYYNTASNNNGQIFHGTSGIDLTKLHVYSMDWEANSLTFLIDGKQIYQITGASVPKDTAHGGNNQVMGMGAETESRPVGMYITEAQYTSTPDIAAQGGVTSVMAAQMARENPTTTVTPPPTTPSAPAPPVDPTTGASSFVIGSITEVAGHLVVVGDKESGSAATVHESVDGHYVGVVEDDAPDGRFTFSLAGVSTGSHVMLLTLDGSSLQATMAFTTGTAAASPPTAPVTPTAPVPDLSITSLNESGGELILAGVKETGATATMRETMDGNYVGTLWDRMPDGAFSMQIADVIAGAHVLTLTLDGSSATATYDFTKLASGSILHAVVAASTSASASTLVAVTHSA
nr:family 16 glycosylhydrolase [uncultured Lichenicoccus sp.]